MLLKHFAPVITPYLMGQYREGLRRVEQLTSYKWTLNDSPEYREVLLQSSDEKIARMGDIYLQLSEKVKELVGNNCIPVSISGDCVSSIGVLAGLQKAGRNPDRVIWLDAHGDFHTWQTSQTQYIGGMPLAMFVGRGDQRVVQAAGLTPYPEQQIIFSDGRDLDAGEREALESSAIVRCIPDSIAGLINGEESIYLHWDTDFVSSLDEMPAMKYHVAAGPSPTELSQIFKQLSRYNIIAISVSAWHEELDTDNRTAIKCLELLANLGVV